jgi:hypothetical protein
MPTLAWSHPVADQREWFIRRRERKCVQEDNLGDVKAGKLAQELEWSDQHAKRERRYVDNHDRILAADMDRSFEANKAWRLRSLDAFEKRRAFDQMYRSLARREVRRKELMVGLGSDDPREIDAQCNLYNAGAGISKFPRKHCCEDLIEMEERTLKRHIQAGHHKLKPAYNGIRPTAGGTNGVRQFPLPTGFPCHPDPDHALGMSLSSPSLLQWSSRVPVPPPGTVLEKHHTIQT